MYIFKSPNTNQIYFVRASNSKNMNLLEELLINITLGV